MRGFIFTAFIAILPTFAYGEECKGFDESTIENICFGLRTNPSTCTNTCGCYYDDTTGCLACITNYKDYPYSEKGICYAKVSELCGNINNGTYTNKDAHINSDKDCSTLCTVNNASTLNCMFSCDNTTNSCDGNVPIKSGNTWTCGKLPNKSGTIITGTITHKDTTGEYDFSECRLTLGGNEYKYDVYSGQWTPTGTCLAGYYGSAGNCNPCPAGSTSEAGDNATIQRCFLLGGKTQFCDSTGCFTVPNDTKVYYNGTNATQ